MAGYTASELSNLKTFYQRQLLEDTLPFWFPRAIDEEHGGYLLMRDRDGSLLDDDKAVWIQGRVVWLLSTLYHTLEPRADWLQWAKSGVDFLERHGFDENQRMYFHLTRDGRPIRQRRYFFSETFATIGFAAYAKASGDERIAARARDLFGKCIAYAEKPELLPAKYTATRPVKSLAVPMIMINTAQQVRDTIGDHRCDAYIDRWISEIERDFVKHDLRCVMEQVALDGSIIDHFDGRLITPGHAIEASWFILNEAKHRGNDERLIRLGCAMLDYMWDRGWDTEHGGIFYFRDVFNKPVQEYYHHMKFWWPHNEFIIATLFAFLLTGQTQYADMHRAVHAYAYKHFHDRVYGEWYGYLNRDGTVAQPAKGNLFKGPFHLPRQEWYCSQLLSWGGKMAR